MSITMKMGNNLVNQLIMVLGTNESNVAVKWGHFGLFVKLLQICDVCPYLVKQPLLIDFNNYTIAFVWLHSNSYDSTLPNEFFCDGVIKKWTF
jgi:hypothetical protein